MFLYFCVIISVGEKNEKVNKNINNYYFFIITLVLVQQLINLFNNLNSYKIRISSKNNNDEILQLISNEYNNSKEVTTVILKPKLGDGELYLYNHFRLCKNTLISDNNDLIQYILENGYNPSIEYILKILILVIIIFLLKTFLDNLNNKKENSKKILQGGISIYG